MNGSQIKLSTDITDCKAQKPESQICSLTKKHIDIFQVKKHTPTMEIFHIIIQITIYHRFKNAQQNNRTTYQPKYPNHGKFEDFTRSPKLSEKNPIELQNNKPLQKIHNIKQQHHTLKC